MSHVVDTTAVSRSLVYLVSPRGGDNFWARVINGCDKTYVPGLGTASVRVAPNGRYTLAVDDGYFRAIPEPMQKLILIHEAGHIALRHLERLFRLQCNLMSPTLRRAVMVVFNIAADLACNDKIVRNEPEFAEMLKIGAFDGLLPERMKYPLGLSMEGYMSLLVQDLPEALKHMRDMLANPGEGDGDGEDGKENQGAGGQQQKSKQGKSGNGAGGAEEEPDDAQLPPGLGAAAENNPELIAELEELFNEISNNAHKQWNEQADRMTAEEAGSMTDKMKKHAKQLVKRAHDQSVRSRGSVPSHIERLVQGLLKPEQIPWHWLLDDALQGAIHSKILEEMAMPNMSLIAYDEYSPWPGFTLDRKFRVYWFTDTSGSVSDLEYTRACSCMNALMSVNKSIELIHLQGDAACQSEEVTDNLSPPEKGDSLPSRAGYGGTVYTSQFKRILNVDTPEDWVDPSKRPLEHPGKPDLVVCFTDGGVDLLGSWGNEPTFPAYQPDVPIVWLLAPGCVPAPGMDDLPPNKLIKMFELKGEYEE